MLCHAYWTGIKRIIEAILTIKRPDLIYKSLDILAFGPNFPRREVWVTFCKTINTSSDCTLD